MRVGEGGGALRCFASLEGVEGRLLTTCVASSLSSGREGNAGGRQAEAPCAGKCHYASAEVGVRNSTLRLGASAWYSAVPQCCDK